MQTRQQIIDSLRTRPDVSVLIIGGGINGAGLLRELALQQIDALLIDKSDFCAGASAASSHMIHGGLRYLENGEFRLVRESLQERNRLLQNAAHYVRPLATTIPIFSWTGGFLRAAARFLRLTDRPSTRGALLVKIGLLLYDVFTRRQRVLPRHCFRGRAASLALRPQLHPQIVCTARYFDAWISQPERLCIELVLDAEAVGAHARALNYVRLAGSTGDTLTLEDELSGSKLEIRPGLIVNATGAWIDLTNALLGRSTQLIGGTKGSHLVVEHPQLLEATRGEMLYYENADGRICILFPFYDKVLVGSTDIYVTDPDAVRCEEEEVDYILSAVRQIFPGINVERSHIVASYCGVRPLPRDDVATPGQATRDHYCAVVPPGAGQRTPIYCLLGGKWTTFRAFAEQVTDQLLQVLGRPRIVSTRQLAIGGGRGYPASQAEREAWLEQLHSRTGLPWARLETLLERYGTRAALLAAYLVAGADAPLGHHPSYTRREIAFLALQERVLHLDDLVRRRTPMALLGQLSEDLLAELGAVVGEALGWSSSTISAEIAQAACRLASSAGQRLQPQPAARGAQHAAG